MSRKPSLGILDELYAVVTQRIRDKPPGSYTAEIARRGIGYAARKLGEEAVETMVEALERRPDGVVREAADLLYHLVVLLALSGVSTRDVAEELARRRRGEK